MSFDSVWKVLQIDSFNRTLPFIPQIYFLNFVLSVQFNLIFVVPFCRCLLNGTLFYSFHSISFFGCSFLWFLSFDLCCVDDLFLTPYPLPLRNAQHNINPSPYPYNSVWDYAGDNFLKPKAHNFFHRFSPTLYYYSYFIRETKFWC